MIDPLIALWVITKYRYVCYDWLYLILKHMEHTRKMYFNERLFPLPYEFSFGRPQDQEDIKVLFGSNCVKTNRYVLNSATADYFLYIYLLRVQ